MGYCFLPTTKGQKMLMLIGRGGEGKSRIGVVLRALLGSNMATGSIAKVESSRFARADLEHELVTLDDLEARLDSLHSSLDEVKTLLDANRKRSKELRDWMKYAELFKRFKPLYNELCAIRWRPKREKFKSEHESELRQFYMARRKLPGGIHTADWQHELATLECENDAAYAKYKRFHDELVGLLDVKYCIDRALAARENEGRETRLLVNER